MGVEYLNNRVFEGIIKKFQYSKRQKARYELIIKDLKLAKEHRERRKDKKHHELALTLLEKKNNEYKQIYLEFIQSQDDLAAAFYTLSQNIVKYAKFQHIDDDDAIQEGVVICFEKIDHFDPQKGKAFNYMTTCILNHFRQLYRSARNYQELKKRYLGHLQKELEKVIIHNGKQHSTSTKIVPMEGSRSNY
jgi:DNA-directed RNA polymerase specialized sigma subunit